MEPIHKERLDKNKIRLVSLISFVFGFLDAFFIYILSTYFSTISGSDNVGMFYLISYSGVLVSLFFLQRLIRFMGKARILYLALGVSIVSCTLLTILPASYWSVAAVFALIIATNLLWVALDILLESYSKDHVSGRIRGLYLTIMNAGLLAAPLLSVKTLDAYHYEGIFFVLIIGYSLVFIIALLGFRDDNRVFVEKLALFSTTRKMLRERNLLRIYYISFAMEFFYALMTIYTPLYLRLLGYSWSDIGIIFTIMLVPFVLLQYPLGILADRYFGEKEMLIGSITIAMVATASLPLLPHTHSVVWMWALFLFLTRVGIAGIEILRDSYFYKQIDGNDMDVIAFFRTARPVANIVGAILSGVTLLFLPLESVFFIVALVLFLALFHTFFLRDTVSEFEVKAGLAK